MDVYRKWLAELRGLIRETQPENAHALSLSGCLLVDIRTKDERLGGAPAGCLSMPRSRLEGLLASKVAGPEETVILICQSGVRSLIAARNLQDMGFTDVRSVSGGFEQWVSTGLPVEVPEDEICEVRYARHLSMPKVGVLGQGLISQAKVLVVGAGGLGSPASLYLAAAGVGQLGLVDGDKVELSNLQRQILHSTETLGWPKVASAGQSLRRLNGDINVVTYFERVNASNVVGLVAEYDIILDGTDNYDVRRLLSDACVAAEKTYIYGSVYQFEGQVGVFGNRASEGGACFTCFQPVKPSAAASTNCSEAGVLGVLPGLIGCMQALETLKVIIGLESPANSRILHFDGEALELSTFSVSRRKTCAVCLAASKK
mgnify:CR=1 FL=1